MGNGMKKLVSVMVALLVALMVTAPVGAQFGTATIDDPQMEMRGFVHEYDNLTIVAGKMDVGSASDAKMVVRFMDADLMEDSFGGMVILEEAMDREMLAAIGASTGNLYGLMNGDELSMAMVFAVDGSVYMVIMVGDFETIGEDSGYLFGTLVVEIVYSGDDFDFDTPDGYIEVPLDDDDLPISI